MNSAVWEAKRGHLEVILESVVSLRKMYEETYGAGEELCGAGHLRGLILNLRSLELQLEASIR